MIKKLICLGLFLMASLFLFSQDQTEILSIIDTRKIEANQNQAQLIIGGDIEQIHPRYSMDTISISLLNRSELRILRNTIFARYGYIFKSQDLTDYFSQFDWYRPAYSNVDNMLTYADHRNIEIIRSFESIDMNQEDTVLIPDLAGLWHISLIMPSGYAEVFQFYENGTFKYRYSQMRQLPEIRLFSGRYEISGNALILKADKKEIYKHGQDTDYSGAFGYQYDEVSVEQVEYQQEYVFSISKIKTVEDLFDDFPEGMGERKAVVIGGEYYFLNSSNPDNYN